MTVKSGDKVRLNKATLPSSLSELFGAETFTLVGRVRQVTEEMVVVEWPRPYEQATYLEPSNVIVLEAE